MKRKKKEEKYNFEDFEDEERDEYLEDTMDVILKLYRRTLKLKKIRNKINGNV